MFRFVSGCLVLFGCSRLPPDEGSFPDGFRFGASTSAFQVEDGCPSVAPSDCADPNSDWYAFASSPLMTSDPLTHLSGDRLSDGPGHWELFDSDFARARSLHLSAFRLSIDWSRIFPVATDDAVTFEQLHAIANLRSVEHYHAVFRSLRAHGLEPFVTLNHQTLPLWIHDSVGCHRDIDHCSNRGWLDRERIVREIAKYAGFVAQEYGGEVDTWATLNEPLATSLPGYLFPSPDRSNPPAVMLRYADVKTSIVAQLEAHARMYDAIKLADLVDADGDGNPSDVGLVYAANPVAPKNPNDPSDVRAAEHVFYLWNSAFLNGVIRGDVDAKLDGNVVHRSDLEHRIDFIGLNYYTRPVIEGRATPQLPELSPMTDFNLLSIGTMEEYPRGIYEVAMLARSYGIPAVISENGAPNAADPGAPRYLVNHLRWLARAIRDGAPIRGYYYWSLIDNLEWNHGFGIRMGLYSVDNRDVYKKRAMREVGATYARIAAAGVVPSDLLEAYPEQ